MIVNYYLADKNTTEIFKISGSYKFDSWTKQYTINVTIELDFEQVFPEQETEVIGRFVYLLDGVEYYTDVTITDEINNTKKTTHVIYQGETKPTKYNGEYAWLRSSVDPINLENYQDVFHQSSSLETAVDHIIGVQTNLDYDFTDAVVGKYYKVTYTLFSEDPFSVYILLGTNKGVTRTQSGTYTEYLKLTNNQKISFIASGLVRISNFTIEEYVVIADELDFTDKDGFINYSWTMSYSLATNNWVSFHSYIPDYYLTSHTGMYSLMNDELSVEFTIRDDENNYIIGSDNEIITYYKYTYG